MKDEGQRAGTDVAGAGPPSAPQERPPAKRDWLTELSASDGGRARARRAALDAAIEGGVPVTLSGDEIPKVAEGGLLPVVDIMLGATRIGLLILEDRGETLWIGKIGIDEDLQGRGYGQRAIALLSALAAKERYRTLAGEIALGPTDVMERRRRFCRKAGFTVRTDDKVERHLDVPRRMFARRPFRSATGRSNCWARSFAGRSRRPT